MALFVRWAGGLPFSRWLSCKRTKVHSSAFTIQSFEEQQPWAAVDNAIATATAAAMKNSS